jgi:hypothetical protein
LAPKKHHSLHSKENMERLSQTQCACCQAVPSELKTGTATICRNCHRHKTEYRISRGKAAHECSEKDTCIVWNQCPTKYLEGHPEEKERRRQEKQKEKQLLAQRKKRGRE